MSDKKVVTLRLDDVEPVVSLEITSGAVLDEAAQRREVETMAERFRETWNLLDGPRRAALASLISEALTELARDVDVWLADALIAAPNEKIGIFMLFKLGNVNDQVVRLRQKNENERERSIAELAALTRA